MTQSLTSLDPLFQSIVLATLAIGLPIILILAIRFLWDRNLKLTRSKDLEKLIWQLHRIATALEHQLSLPSTAIQPGTEEPRDLVYLQELPSQPTSPSPDGATPQAMAAAAASNPATTPQPSPPAQARQAPSGQPQRAGVNSMFGI
ncbi:MAG: hypothetical protein WCE61_22220 [Candidatus Acidiferrum sp.]